MKNASRNNTADTAIRLRFGRPRKRVLFPAEALALSLFQSIQAGPETHAISYSIDTGRSLATGKEAGAQNSPFTMTKFPNQERAHLYLHFPI